eukprot:2591581-Amphidinium_carterae.1
MWGSDFTWLVLLGLRYSPTPPQAQALTVAMDDAFFKVLLATVLASATCRACVRVREALLKQTTPHSQAASRPPGLHFM